MPKESVHGSESLSEENHKRGSESCNNEMTEHYDMQKDENDPLRMKYSRLYPQGSRQRIKRWLSSDEESSLGSVTALAM